MHIIISKTTSKSENIISSFLLFILWMHLTKLAAREERIFVNSSRLKNGKFFCFIGSSAKQKNNASSGFAYFLRLWPLEGKKRSLNRRKMLLLMWREVFCATLFWVCGNELLIFACFLFDVLLIWKLALKLWVLVLKFYLKNETIT